MHATEKPRQTPIAATSPTRGARVQVGERSASSAEVDGQGPEEDEPDVGREEVRRLDRGDRERVEGRGEQPPWNARRAPGSREQRAGDQEDEQRRREVEQRAEPAADEVEVVVVAVADARRATAFVPKIGSVPYGDDRPSSVLYGESGESSTSR